MKPETRSFYELAVERAIERVLASLDEALDLQQLARGAALSPLHFLRIFRGMVGETPLELHRRLRMERAALHLVQRDSAVTTLAFEAGYDTHEAFTRAFRERYACSPSECRQRGRRDAASCERPVRIEIAARCGIHFDSARDPSSKPLIRLIQGEHAMHVEKKDLAELRTATLRHIGPYNRIAEAFARLGELAGRAGLLDTKPTMLALYHDDPEVTPEAELRSDAAIVIPENKPVPPGLIEQVLAAGRYALTTHVGPYEQLGDVWARFMGQWLPQSGERIASGVSFELYRNNPLEVPKEQLVTELYVPLV